jgi:hypothetical protein
MNDFGAEQDVIICQLLLFLMCASLIGPWWTVSGLRIIRKPSRVNRKSVMNRIIRRSAKSGLAQGNVRFWAWIYFVGGIGMDLLAALVIVGMIAALLQ